MGKEDINMLYLNIEQTCGKKFLLRAIRENKKFENGKPTDTTDGFILELIQLERKMLDLVVKVDEIDKSLIEKVNADEMPAITFTGLTATPYVTNNGKLGISYRIEKITEVK